MSQQEIKKSVGVVLIAEKEGKDGTTREAAICSIRPHFKPGAPGAELQRESFGKGSQVFAAGGLTKEEAALPGSEGFLKGLQRELTEELGQRIADLVMKNLVRSAGGEPEVVGQKQTPEREVRTYHARVPMSLSELRELVVPSPEVYGIRAVPVEKLEQVMQPLQKDPHKTAGVPLGEVRLFEDEIKAHVAAAGRRKG